MSPRRRLPRAMTVGTAALLAVLSAAFGGVPATGGAAAPEAMGRPVRQPDYKLEAAAGLGGLARLGWVHVHVTVQATREFEGDLVARLRNQYAGRAGWTLFETRKRVQLAAGSRTEHHLYIRHDSPGLNQGGMEVLLESEDGDPVKDSRVTPQLNLVPRSQYLMCVVAEKPFSLAAVEASRSSSGGGSSGGNANRQFVVAKPALAELPDRSAGYNEVDCLLLWQVPFEKLRREQITAIGDYLQQGGCVVLCGRDRAWYVKPEVRELAAIRDVQPATAAEADALIRKLTESCGGFAGNGAGGTIFRFDVPGSSDVNGFYADLGFHHVERGAGAVLVWRLDPEARVIGTWPGLLPLWSKIAEKRFKGRAADDGGYYHYGFGAEKSAPLVNARQTAALLNVARERSVPGLLIVFLVVLYLVLAGPINYFALRRLDMRALSIVTLPLLAAIFVLLNFAAGYISRGVLTSGRRVTVAVAPSGTVRAECTTWLGLFPASSSLADVSTDGRGLLLPLTDTNVADSGYQPETYTALRELRGEERFLLERYPLAMWKMFHFQAESVRPLGGAVKLVALGGGRFKVVNGTPLELRDCLVTAGPGGAEFCWVGSLPAGAERDGTLARWSQRSGSYASRGRQPVPLSMEAALGMWLDGRLGAGSEYAVSEKPEGFAPQAAQVLSRRLGNVHPRGMLLLARVQGEELEPLHVDGRSPRGESADVLVVTAESGGGGRP